MKKCKNCGKEFENDIKFCSACGGLLEEIKGETETAVNEAETASAAPTEQLVEPETKAFETAGQEPAAVLEPVMAGKKFKFGKKQIIAAASSLVAVVLIVAIIISIFSGVDKDKNNYVLYFKDGEIAGAALSNLKPMEITDDLNDDSDGGNYSELYLKLRGDRLFYPEELDNRYDDEYDYETLEFDLFYRDLSKPKKDPVKIDSGVNEYAVNKTGNIVTYVIDGNLYQHNLKRKEKIASDVRNYLASEDGKTVYFESDDKVYVKYYGKEKKKIDSDAELGYVSPDFKTLYYLKGEGNLYKCTNGNKKVKIDSDVSKVLAAYNSGEIYYKKTEEEEIPYSRFIEDDMLEKDSKAKEPDYSSYSSYSAWSDAFDEYYDAQERDNWRDLIEEETYYSQKTSLYYYNGKNEKLLCDSISDYYNDCATEKPVIGYTEVASSDTTKIKMSEIESYYDIEEMIEEATEEENGKLYVAIKDKTFEVAEEFYYFHLDEEGSYIYYSSNYNEKKDTFDLYKAKISGGKLGKAELIDSDVDGISAISENGSIWYRKDYKNGGSDLYKDGKKIDSDVYYYEVEISEDGKTAIYYSDYNDGTATLKIYKNGKISTIADDVLNAYIADNGDVIYLGDYSERKETGDLMRYKNGKSKLIEEDVSQIIGQWNYKWEISDWNYKW